MHLSLFQALPYVALLIAMLFFIYAVIGMQVILGVFSIQQKHGVGYAETCLPRCFLKCSLDSGAIY